MVPLSPTTAVDHMESVFAEPLSTDNGLDRYHQVAQKVTLIVIFEPNCCTMEECHGLW